MKTTTPRMIAVLVLATLVGAAGYKASQAHYVHKRLLEQEAAALAATADPTGPIVKGYFICAAGRTPTTYLDEVASAEAWGEGSWELTYTDGTVTMYQQREGESCARVTDAPKFQIKPTPTPSVPL